MLSYTTALTAKQKINGVRRHVLDLRNGRLALSASFLTYSSTRCYGHHYSDSGSASG